MTIVFLAAQDLKPKDYVDLAGDKFADINNDRPEFNTDWQIIKDVMVVAEGSSRTAVLCIIPRNSTREYEVKVPADHRIKVRKDMYSIGAPRKSELRRVLDKFYRRDTGA